jgi:hypothetical protein
VEHLERRACRVVEGDDFLDSALVGLGRRKLLEGHTGRVQRGLDLFQPGVVAHLPTDGDDAVDFPRHHHDAGRPLVHPEVQR